MKKALKFLSVILSLAMVLSMFTFASVSAEEKVDEPVNLIKYADFTPNDKGEISGWSFSTTNNSTYTIEEDANGYNTIVIDSPDNTGNFDLGTTEITNLHPNKYYKVSVSIKIDANEKGLYGGSDFQNTSLLIKEKSSKRYAITDIIANSAVKGVWKEYSIIISGENFYTSENPYTEVCLYSEYANCKFYVKCPSIVEYDPDVADEVATIEPQNLITNGNFSKYDGSIKETNIDKFTDFSISYKGTNAAYHEQVTVNLNGNETTAAKIRSADPNNNGFQAYFNPKIDKTKDYRLSMWIMLTNADAYDETTQTWVPGTEWDVDGSISLMAGKQNGNIKKTVTISETKNVWQYVELFVDSQWHSASVWSDGIRFGITTWGCDFNIYITDVRVEEFVGNVEAANAESVITNGDFETYDETTNKFAGWTLDLWNTSNTFIRKGEGITGNAVKLVATSDGPHSYIKQSVGIDSNFDYKVTAYVKTENGDTTVGEKNFNNQTNKWNILCVRATAGTVVVNSDDILYSDDWQKIELLVSDIPDGTSKLEFKLVAEEITGNILLDNISVVPVTGGSVSVNRSNAAAGDTVYVTVNPDWGSRLAENGLTYLANGATESVAITESKSEVYTFQTGKDGVDRKVYTAVASDNPNLYQFSMPEKADIVVSAVFEEIAAIAGDANWNGTVDILDLIRVKKYLAGVDVNINLENATLETEIEGVDGNDLAALRRILLGV